MIRQEELFMKIDLTQLLEGKISELAVEDFFTPGDEDAAVPHGIKLASPMHVFCKVKDNHGCLTLTASAEAEYETVCDRCLSPISTSLSFSIERLIESKGTHITADDPDFEDEDDILHLVNGCVEIGADLAEAFVLELPMRHLCDEECPGLCPKCGKRRADGDCGCKFEKEIDPRLKVFQKLLEKPQ